jgi:serine/threonine protein kinase
MLVSELVSRGDLEKMLHDQTVPLSLPRRLRMATDAVVGMCWLHSPTQSIIHRDLKSSNLLVDDHYRIKVCDFGLSQVLAAGEQARDERSAKGTPLWMAPEVMQFKPFDRKCDVYSFGIVLWEIVTREEPFKEFNNYNVFRDAVCRQHVRPPIPPNTLPALDQLMRTMWHHDPAARPEFLQVLEVLKGLVVDAAIRDPLCRQFWKAHFLTEDPAAWQNCCPLLLEFLQVSPAIIDVLRSNTAQAVAVMAQQSPELAAAQRNVACLRAVLADDATGGALTVGLEKFGRVMDVFAPIQQNQSVLDDIQLLLQVRFNCASLSVFIALCNSSPSVLHLLCVVVFSPLPNRSTGSTAPLPLRKRRIACGPIPRARFSFATRPLSSAR